MDFETKSPHSFANARDKNPLEKHTKKLLNALKKYDASEIGSLMGLSEKLSYLNHERYQEWNKAKKKSAIFAFRGDVYVGLDICDFNKPEMERLDKKVWILSGLYGCLKPSDLIKPYRLEMGSKLPTNGAKDLYAFWQESISDVILNSLLPKEAIVNLASKEYFKAVQSLENPKILHPIYSPVFLEKKDGHPGKVIGLFSKKARGMMTRFIIKQKVNKVEDLKLFNDAGYRFIREEVTPKKNQTTLFFEREIATV